MTEGNQDTELQNNETVDNNEEYLRRQKNKTEALMRYINDQVAVQKTAPVRKKTTKEKIKEAVVGIATIFYMTFIGPLFSPKVKSRLGLRIFMIILIQIFAYWMYANVFKGYENEQAAKNYPQDIMYQANQARDQQQLNTSGKVPN